MGLKEINEKDVEQYVMNPMNDKFEQKMSRYLLYLKYGCIFEWDTTINQDFFDFVGRKKVVYREIEYTRTVASKTIFKGNQNVELICSYQTNKSGWYTFGIFFFFLLLFFFFFFFHYFFFLFFILIKASLVVIMLNGILINIVGLMEQEVKNI